MVYDQEKSIVVNSLEESTYPQSHCHVRDITELANNYSSSLPYNPYELEICKLEELEKFIQTEIGYFENIYSGNSDVYKIANPNHYEFPIVLKLKKVDSNTINAYIDSLQFQYRLRNSDSSFLRFHTLPIYKTFLVRVSENDFIVMTEFTFIKNTLGKILGTEKYEDDSMRLKHIKDLLHYLELIHAQLEGRSFISDIKPDNIFISDDNEILIHDLEYSGGTPIYIIPSILYLDDRDQLNIDLTKKVRLGISFHENDIFAFRMVANEILRNAKLRDVINNIVTSPKELVSFLNADSRFEDFESIDDYCRFILKNRAKLLEKWIRDEKQ
jgi:serine/threonine protein kinase